MIIVFTWIYARGGNLVSRVSLGFEEGFTKRHEKKFPHFVIKDRWYQISVANILGRLQPRLFSVKNDFL